MPSKAIQYLNSLAPADETKVSLSAPYYSRGSPVPDEDPPSRSPSDSDDAPPAGTPDQPQEPIEGETSPAWQPSDPDAVNTDPAPSETDTIQILSPEEEEPQTPPDQSVHIDNPVAIETSQTSEAPDEQVAEPRGTTPADPHVYPTCIRRPPVYLMSIYHITAMRALREYPATVRPAIEAKLGTMLEMGVFTPVYRNDLTAFHRKNIIRSQLNITQKFLPSSDNSRRTKDNHSTIPTSIERTSKICR